MPYLFCQEHGRNHEARCMEEEENHRWFGEVVLIVTGPLKSPSHRCLACKLRLRRGQRAYLVTALPRPTPEDIARYDFAAEGEYVVLEHAEARLYGADWPCGKTPLPPRRIDASASMG